MKDVGSEDYLQYSHWIAIVALFTVLAAGVNLFTLTFDPPYPALSLFMIPVVIATFFFRRQGLLASLLILALFSVVIWLYSPDKFAELRVLENVTVVFGVALIVTLLSTALHRSENSYRLLFETSPAPIIVLKPDGSIVDVNSRFFSVFGYGSIFVEGKKIQQLPIIAEESLIEIGERLMNPEPDGDNQEPFIIKVMDASGDMHICNVFSSFLYDETGIPESCMMVLVDITENVKAEEEIKRSLEEKETLLKEIHHRVKNNLQEVVSILKLQRNRTTDEDVQWSLKECQNRVYTMAMVHENIYRADSLSSIGIKAYLEKLARDLLIEYMSPGQNISFEIECSDDIEFDIDGIIPVALITNELISNSMKYAFPGGRKGMIRIAVEKTPDNSYRYTYSDDGVGFPPGLRIDKTKTLGLRIVRAFVRQLDGSIEFVPGTGTKIIITFPIKE
ncbi:sensor histidine kinase [Methanolacinia petrolearia]|uniref:sensor histidine kinase n=1 Tax=Methanolacinia petrolearia TaxID=54120 RepID=UPI0011D0A115|nr:histidine kinase dimerization/phosphoacceptor domain -containing protein [Methanolacinia petrolearia]